MIKVWEQKDWLKRRQRLEEELKKIPILKYATVKRYDGRIEIVGGALPMAFGDDGKLKVWSRCTRHSGVEVLVTDLMEIEQIVKRWLEQEVGCSK